VAEPLRLADWFLVEYGLEVGCDIAVNLALATRPAMCKGFISVYTGPKKFALLILNLLDIFKILDNSKTTLLLFIYILTELCYYRKH
jgi:hypothetical protein